MSVVNGVLKGTLKIMVAGLKFTNENKHQYTLNQVKNAGESMAEFYNRNSRGLLSINIVPKLVNIPFVGDASSVLGRAGPYVKDKFPGCDFYVLISRFVKGDHQGGKFAYCKTTLIQSIKHETGHCLNLAHAGAYKYSGDSFTYDQYGDGLSPMSAYDSSCLTSPAYHYEGWTPESEIVVIDSSDKLPATFELKRINNFSAPGISIVIIKASVLKNPTGRDAYISYPQQTKFFGTTPFVALHLLNGAAVTTGKGYGGGSAKVKTFAKEYYDKFFTGLNMVIEEGATNEKLKVTVKTMPVAISQFENMDEELSEELSEECPNPSKRVKICKD